MQQTEQGFTLIEVLFALSVLACILLLVPKYQTGQLEKTEQQQFLEMLDMDLLYLQSMSSLGAETRYHLTFHEDHYKIIHGLKIFIHRNYPAHVTIPSGGRKEIRFNGKGLIIQPRTILIEMGEESYRLVFPFGKGRFYAEKR